MWRLAYEPGTIRAVTRKDGRIIMEKEIRTADEPAAIELVPDREKILADGRDLCFITVRVLDKNGNLCPRATNLIEFRVSGSGRIAGVDNGYQASLESFKADHRKAFNGMCLLIVRAANKKGKIEIEALSEDLASARINVRVR
jgi:beta-galactosidase